MGGDWTLVRMSGPLEAHVPGFASELEQVGYTRHSTTDQPLHRRGVLCGGLGGLPGILLAVHALWRNQRCPEH